MLSICQQGTEASIQNGGWSLGTGHVSTPLVTWCHQAALLLYDETTEGANGIRQRVLDNELIYISFFISLREKGGKKFPVVVCFEKESDD